MFPSTALASTQSAEGGCSKQNDSGPRANEHRRKNYARSRVTATPNALGFSSRNSASARRAKRLSRRAVFGFDQPAVHLPLLHTLLVGNAHLHLSTGQLCLKALTAASSPAGLPWLTCAA